jgi:hypothetical protein
MITCDVNSFDWHRVGSSCACMHAGSPEHGCVAVYTLPVLYNTVLASDWTCVNTFKHLIRVNFAGNVVRRSNNEGQPRCLHSLNVQTELMSRSACTLYILLVLCTHIIIYSCISVQLFVHASW